MKKKINVLYIPSWYPDEINPKHGISFKEQAEMLNNYCNINILNIERISVKFLSKFFNFILKRNKFIISGNIVNYKYLDYTLKNIELRVKLFEKNVLKSFELYLKFFFA